MRHSSTTPASGGEAGEEHDGSAGRRLIHAARMLRAPQLRVDRYGTSNYRIMLADCLWHVNRMIGKLWGVTFLIKRPIRSSDLVKMSWT